MTIPRERVPYSAIVDRPKLELPAAPKRQAKPKSRPAGKKAKKKAK